MKMKCFAALICLAVAATAYAADPPAAPVDDSAAPAASTGNPQRAAAEPQPLSETAMPRSSSAPASKAKSTSAKSASAAPRSPVAATRKTADRLDLDTTNVTGNRELPKVLYIVPWKKADIGELPAQPFNTLLDEVLTPVDRDVFRREVTYYGAVAAGTGAAAGAAAPVSNSSHGSEK